MPTNTRTPIGGDICAPTPSDLAGTMDNILSRLEKIEEAFAQHIASDTTAIDLSHITYSYGAANNALAVSMLPAGVTEQYPGSAYVTAYGTISGIVFGSDFYKNLYGGVDGVMSFPVGSQPTPGWISGAPDYYKFYRVSGVTVIDQGQNTTVGLNTFTTATTSGSLRVTVTSGGLWLARGYSSWRRTGGSLSGVSLILGTLELDGGPVGLPDKYHHEAYEIGAVNSVGGYTGYIEASNDTVHVSRSEMFMLNASDRIQCNMGVSGIPNLGTTTFTLNTADVSLVRLGSAT